MVQPEVRPRRDLEQKPFLQRHSGFHHLGVLVKQPGAAVEREQLAQPPAYHLVPLAVYQPLPSRVDTFEHEVFDTAGPVTHGGQEAYGFEAPLHRRPEPLLASPQLLIAPLAVGNVGVDADPLTDLPAGGEDRHGPGGHVTVLTVRPSEAVLDGVGMPPRQPPQPTPRHSPPDPRGGRRPATRSCGAARPSGR